MRTRVSYFAVTLLLGTSSCGGGSTAPPESLIGRFDLFWDTFDRHYSYFDYKQVNWDSLRTVYRPQAMTVQTQDGLVALLKQMASPLRDVHVRFTTPTGAQQPTFTPQAVVNWDRNVWRAITNSCNLNLVRPDFGYCRMNGVAYVFVGSWNPSAVAITDIDAAIDVLRDASAMIVDVRPNGGGNDAIAFAFAGRFATGTTTTGYVRFRDGPEHDDFGGEIRRQFTPRGSFQFTKPVILLTGRGVYSSNESFVSAMRELPNVVVLGDTTGGGSGNPATYELGGGWSFSVSRWIEWTADRRIIEWNGIPPDTVVAWNANTVSQGRDPVLEAAIARLSAPRLHPPQRRRDDAVPLRRHRVVG